MSSWWKRFMGLETRIDLGEKFKEANATSELVISSGPVNDSNKIDYKQNLDDMTKQQLIDFAESEIGITIDRRLTKSRMIERIIEETP
jgi:hypothetical protein